MIAVSRQVRVWACAEPVSIRKSFDGLYDTAKASLGRDPLAGDMFLFVARDRRQARVLYWDGTGLLVIAKSLRRDVADLVGSVVVGAAQEKYLRNEKGPGLRPIYPAKLPDPLLGVFSAPC